MKYSFFVMLTMRWVTVGRLFIVSATSSYSKETVIYLELPFWDTACKRTGISPKMDKYVSSGAAVP